MPWAARLVHAARIEGYEFPRDNLQSAHKRLRALLDPALCEEFELAARGVSSPPPPVPLQPDEMDKNKRLRLVPNWRRKQGSGAYEPCLEIFGYSILAVFSAPNALLKNNRLGWRWDGDARYLWSLDAAGLARTGCGSFEKAAREISLRCAPHREFTVVRPAEAGKAADALRVVSSATPTEDEPEPEIKVVASRTPDEVEEDKLRAAKRNGTYVDLTLSHASAQPTLETPPQVASARVKTEPGAGGPQRTPPSSRPPSAKVPYASPKQPSPSARAPSPIPEKCPECHQAVVTRTARKGLPHNVGRQFITCPKRGCLGEQLVWRWADGSAPCGPEAQTRFEQHAQRHGLAGCDEDQVLFG